MKANRSLYEIDHEIGLFEAGRAAVTQLRRTYEQRLHALESLPVRERLHRARELNDVRLTLGQIDHGVAFEDGTDTQVCDVLFGPLITPLKLRAPGLEPIERVLETLREERAQAEERERTRAAEATPTPRRYRYTGKPGLHTMGDGRGLETGDIVELSPRAAKVLADRFEPVEDEVSGEEVAALTERIARAEAERAELKLKLAPG